MAQSFAAGAAFYSVVQARLGLLLAIALAAAQPHGCLGRIGMTATELTDSSFKDFVSQAPSVLVDFYDPSDPQWISMNQDLQAAVREARSAGSGVPVAKVNVKAESSLMKKFAPNGPYPQLMWFRNGEATQYHRHLRKTKNVVDFIIALDRETIQEFPNAAEVRSRVNRAVWAQLPKASPEYKVLEVVAAKHMDTVEFAWKEAPGTDIRWLEEGDNDNAKFEGAEVTVDNLEKWVRNHLIRSEPLPDPQEGDSVPVVGQTFEQLVLQPDKDTFLFVYAPWCGFCRKFMPAWEALARRTKSVPSLVIAKMDGDRNGSPFPEDFSWNAYPTVFFVKAGTRKPVVFHGNRTEQRLIEFLKENGSREMVRLLEEALNITPSSRSDTVAESDWEL